MMFSLSAILVLIATLANGEKICFPPKSEYKVLTLVTLDELYMAADFDQGKIILTPVNDTKGDTWTLFDLNDQKTYFQPEKGKCLFKECPKTKLMEKCLPENVQYLKTVDHHDLYAMMSLNGMGWVFGVTKIKDSELYHNHLTRVSLYGHVMDIALTYDFSDDISDPSVFEKDLSICKEVKTKDKMPGI